MKKKFFSGNSIHQAVLQAARFFELDPEEIAYREVERRHGFLRGRRRAVIAVDADNPTQLSDGGSEVETSEVATTPEASAPAPAAPAAPETPEVPAAAEPLEAPEAERLQDRPTEELPAKDLAEVVSEVWSEPDDSALPEPAAQPAARSASEPFESLAAEPTPAARRYPQAEGDMAKAARQALDRLFELGQLELEAEVLQGEERLEVELSGKDEEFLLEDRGRLLLAIQHLLPRMLRGLTGNSTACWVDCDNFHEIRMEQLRDLAQRVATEVRTSHRSRTLEPMSPDERRIVHITLTDDPAVETVSQGNGLFKRVQVRPTR